MAARVEYVMGAILTDEAVSMENDSRTLQTVVSSAPVWYDHTHTFEFVSTGNSATEICHLWPLHSAAELISVAAYVVQTLQSDGTFIDSLLVRMCPVLCVNWQPVYVHISVLYKYNTHTI